MGECLMPERIGFYSRNKQYGWLSNFHQAEQIVDYRMYPTNEHYYQSQKAKDPEVRDWIASAPTPFLAMKGGRALRIFEMVDNWHDRKVEVMKEGLVAKFRDNPGLRDKLLETGDAELYEDSPTDKFWGVKGKNMLGILLMDIRDEIRRELDMGEKR